MVLSGLRSSDLLSPLGYLRHSGPNRAGIGPAALNLRTTRQGGGGGGSVRADQARSGPAAARRLRPLRSLPDELRLSDRLLLDARVTAPAHGLEVLQPVQPAVAARNPVVGHQILIGAAGNARGP